MEWVWFLLSVFVMPFLVPTVVLYRALGYAWRLAPELGNRRHWATGYTLFYAPFLAFLLVNVLGKPNFAHFGVSIEPAQFWLIVGPMSAVSSVVYAYSLRSWLVALIPMIATGPTFLAFRAGVEIYWLWVPWIGTALALGTVWFRYFVGPIPDQCPQCRYAMPGASLGDTCPECGTAYRPAIGLQGRRRES